MIPSYYFKEKIVKMGKWALLPLDCENWHGEHTALYYKKVFGFTKESLLICFVDETLAQNAYFPQSYFDLLYAFLRRVNVKDPKGLEKRLLPFYAIRTKAKKEIPKIAVRNYKKLTNVELIRLYKKNRDWAHRVTVHDQFGWTAEEYWPPIMKKILTEVYGISVDSSEYYRVLFILTKPEEISTTLEEKRSVLKEAIAVQQKKKSVEHAAKKLARSYGWMPVFTYGEPWEAKYYATELRELIEKNQNTLEHEYEILKQYRAIRNSEFRAVVKQYGITKKDLQTFLDFGLALDTRNEAEYLVSLAGFYVLPIYREMARRLSISVKQLRCLYEDEIISALQGKLDAEKRLREKGKVIGWGFEKGTARRVNFTEAEAKRLFASIEKRVTNLQGNDEHQGVCASPGTARGIAKIVRSPTENGKVKSGDILITHSTTVDYLPAMKKAAAIVTEVGGLTCHAAVVSREFGVPCVVGLKNATGIFCDDDFVEVDAEHGTVHLLRKGRGSPPSEES
ncbi:MAG: PEP-utilizing enzyme [bacterium]|nr:PEP-utilizing enzyme [bacterium]